MWSYHDILVVLYKVLVIKFPVAETPRARASSSLTDLKRQFHFTSDCSPRKDEKMITGSFNSDHTSPVGSQMVYPSPKGSDVSSDFDFNVSSDGHESGIHPLPSCSLVDISLDDIKEEEPGDLKSSDSSSISTSSPKQTSSHAKNLDFMLAPHSPVKLATDPQPVTKRNSEVSRHHDHTEEITDSNAQNSNKVAKTECEEKGEAIETVRDGRASEDMNDYVFRKRLRTCSEYSDVFPDYSPSENGTVNVSSTTSKQSSVITELKEPSSRIINKVHPRLHALSQLPHHMSPVGNPTMALSAISDTVFGADIATSSPIPPNTEDMESIDSSQRRAPESQELHEYGVPTSATEQSSVVCENLSVKGVAECKHETKIFSLQSSVQSNNTTFEPKESTRIDEINITNYRNQSSMTSCPGSGNFKVPSHARGTKRPFGSCNGSPPTNLSTNTSGLTCNFGVLHVTGPTLKRQKLMKSPGPIEEMDVSLDNQNESCHERGR